MRTSFLLSTLSLLCLTASMVRAVPLSKPGCPDKCGNVTIPYPFGIGLKCSFNSSFEVTCQDITTPNKPLLTSINMTALEFSLDGLITVNQPVSPLSCSVQQKAMPLGNSISESPFNYSRKYNTLAVLGCNNVVWLRENETATVGGCMAICDRNSTDTSCNGVNCCQTTIPTPLQKLNVLYKSIQLPNTGFCGYAFLVAKDWFQDHVYRKYKGFYDDMTNPYDALFQYVPVVLEWQLDDLIASHVRCSYPQQYSYYRQDYPYYAPQLRRPRPDDYYEETIKKCSCDYGFEGNPYLPHGCYDIDECSNSTMKYCTGGTCINGLGYFRCHYPGDKKSPLKIVFIAIGSGLGALLLLAGAWRSYRVIWKKFKAHRKRQFYKRNGGLLLEKHFASSENGFKKTKLFTSKELAQATDHYNENRILGHGGQGTVYKGMLSDGKIVAVKKSKKVDEGDLEVFINEVVILLHINHRNVVKLLGFCLETELPLLVYEYIPNGTLFEHIHNPNDELPLSWEMRVRIATEVAGALAYLHSAASVPIYHRDIKSTNILLDEKYRAKVSDFGTSRSVALDQTHLTTRVLGTFGYLDPEYFQSSQFTDKSDVYSFGVVMVELITGQTAVSLVRSQEAGRSLATHFLYSMEENRLFDIIDAGVLKESTKEQIEAIAQLARRCLQLNGKRRPAMREVVAELESIQMMKGGSAGEHDHENMDHQLIDVLEDYDFSSVSESIRFDTNSVNASLADSHPLLLENNENI